jgi:flagellar biosynthetic protein FliO
MCNLNSLSIDTVSQVKDITMTTSRILILCLIVSSILVVLPATAESLQDPIPVNPGTKIASAALPAQSVQSNSTSPGEVSAEHIGDISQTSSLTLPARKKTGKRNSVKRTTASKHSTDEKTKEIRDAKSVLQTSGTQVPVVAATPVHERDSESKPVFASETSSAKSKSSSSVGFGVGTLISMLAKLGFVLLIAYGASVGVKRLSLGQNTPRTKSGTLQVVESVSLGPNRNLHIVTFGKQTFLVGSTPQQTTLLSELHEAGLPAVQSHEPQVVASIAAPESTAHTEAQAPINPTLAALSSVLSQKLDDLRHIGSMLSKPEVGR